jgi:rod shape determining protein RodA
MFIDYHWLLGQVPVFYGASVGLMLVVFLVGEQVFGSRRWIPVGGGFRFQISEFAKIMVILLVARCLAEMKSETLGGGDLAKLGGLLAIPVALVMKQPDLGTSLTYGAIAGAGVLLTGLRWKYLVAIGLLGLVMVPVGWYLLKDYQKARLVSFVDPERDPQGSGYQIIQSQIAIGAGGMWGRGVTHGTQTQLRFLPVPHTDFIFSAFAEEHGFVGVVFALLLYFLLVMQIVENAQTAPDRVGMFICMGVCACLLFHVLVNVGMVVGRMPVTGIPLPFMSYGGSSTLTFFMMLGLVNNVRLRRFVN